MEAFIEFLKPYGFVFTDSYNANAYKITVPETQIPDFVYEVDQLMPISKICISYYYEIYISFKYTEIMLCFGHKSNYVEIFSDKFNYVDRLITYMKIKTNLCDARIGTLMICPKNSINLDVNYILSAKSINRVIHCLGCNNTNDKYRLYVTNITSETLTFIIKNDLDSYANRDLPNGVKLACKTKITPDPFYTNVTYIQYSARIVVNDFDGLYKALNNPDLKYIDCLAIISNNIPLDIESYNRFIDLLGTFNGKISMIHFIRDNLDVENVIKSGINKLVNANNVTHLITDCCPDMTAIENNTSLMCVKTKCTLDDCIAISDICRMNALRIDFKCAL